MSDSESSSHQPDSQLSKNLEKWRAVGTAQAVELEGTNQNRTRGEVYLQQWDQKARLKRALKVLGVCWGLGLFSVLIPILHFILVPLFLLSGLVIPFIIYQQDAAVLGGVSTCPKCGKPLVIVRAKIKWPLRDVCSRCYENVTIHPV